MLRSLFIAITRASLRFRWVTIGLAVLLIGLGVYCASKMNQELLPPISFPETFVFTLQPNASSEDLRDLITIPLENEVAGIPGVIKAGTESTTVSPASVIVVHYEYGNSEDIINGEVQAAIDRVAAKGVPVGLVTTADLTPEIMTRVLKRAPSMWKHFEARHLQAMAPDVLNAAFQVDPGFATGFDPLTRDQLAASRIDTTFNPTGQPPAPVALPGAWAITKKELPQINAFNLTDLPVLQASISSSALTQEQLRTLVEKNIVPALSDKSALPQIANVSVDGGEIVPPEIHEAAVAAVSKQNQAGGSSVAAAASPTAQAPTPVATAPVPVATAPASGATTNKALALQPAGDPPLPPSWNGLLAGGLLLRPYFNSPGTFNTAADLLNATDKNDKKLTAAETLNIVAASNGFLLRDLTPDIVTYVKSREPDLPNNLTPAAAQVLSAESYAALTGEQVAPAFTDLAWMALADQPGFKQSGLVTVRDLLKFKGGAANALNRMVASTPPELTAFSVRLVGSLTPDMVGYLIGHEPGFLANLNPAVLVLMSADVLKSLPDAFYVDLKTRDAATTTILRTVLTDPSKAAIAALHETTPTSALQDDPKAPPFPASWSALASFGITRADDILRHPFGLSSAADFFNVMVSSPEAAGPLADTTPELLYYFQSKEPTFFSQLQPAVLSKFSAATLAKLPQAVQDAARNSFMPSRTIDRTNGDPAMTLSIMKRTDANTVAVADQSNAVLKQILDKNTASKLAISPIFDQAGFITQSISDVAREGGLGALMAIIVILLFLHFSFRSTLVTAISIPTSVAIAFILMYALPGAVHGLLMRGVPAGTEPAGLLAFLLRLFPASLTLNIMTLSGLTVAIGRVVDDSIVVLENIYRQIQGGKDPKEAVIQGTGDVSVAIFAATLTTVVVFLPIGLTGGVIGGFFLPFGLAVTFALAASFIVAITIIPVMAFLFVNRQPMPNEKEGRLEVIYHGVITWALGHRWGVLGLALVTLAIGGYLFYIRPMTFLPSFGEPQITITVSMPTGYPIAQTDVRVRQMEDYLKGLRDSGGGVKSYQTVIGSGGDLASFMGSAGISGNTAAITVDVSVSDAKLSDLTTRVRARAETIFGGTHNVKVSKATLTDQGFGGFAVVLSGPQDELQKINADVKATLSQVPGLTNVSSSLDLVSGISSRTYLRIGMTPAVQFSAELETQDTLGVTGMAIDAVKAIPRLPADVIVGEGFQSQVQSEGFSSIFAAMGIAVVIVYLVMVITFRSFVHPFTILFSLPVSVVGAAAALTITNRVLGISALIGMLMLIGIVVTNAIVLIDRVQANRRRGLGAREALIEGGRTRLRPILMTAVATMIALSPLAVGLSQGAIIASELGTVVIGGLFSSTLLTLVVVPVVYSLFDSAQRSIFHRAAARER
ncbi:MAG TPA: efflux RND transporter permease subunit [Aggregatilineales bacterium]|nr:efflux RND transporter permease subunit [Aggregatilineales bacterium]